jgi:hypothetical protein
MPGPRGCWTPALETRLERDYAKCAGEGRLPELVAELSKLAGVALNYNAVTAKARRMGLHTAGLMVATTARYAAWSDEEAYEEFKRYAKSKLCVLRYCAKHGYNRGAWARRVAAAVGEEAWVEAVEHNWPSDTWYWQAREKHETPVALALRKLGYDAHRTPMSRSAIDVRAIAPVASPMPDLYIQCKDDGQLPWREWNAVIDHAEMFGAVPLMSSRRDGTFRYYRLEARKLPGWAGRRRQPMTEVLITEDGLVDVGEKYDDVVLFDPACAIATVAA